MQELQLSINGQHTHVPATCGYFKSSSKEEPLIELEEEKKSIWEAFQVFWADANYNELPLILLWNDKGKKKEEKLIWKPNLGAWDTILDEEMWKNIPGRGGACDETCQYTILINDWVQKGTPINDAWKDTHMTKMRSEK
ncbi:hypothetical protein G9A89_014403 [Geosiphon pyriformis]|nr:hypothetical protein G9A89_014403 [Geosiphon pyriformis]